MRTAMTLLLVAGSLLAFAPSSSAALPAPEPEVPIETHCWSAEFGSGCSTTVTTGVAICTYSSWTSNEGQSWSDLECSNTTVGACHIGLTPVQDPPNVWCENYQPPGDGSAARVAPPELPCQSGIAGSWCTVGALDCAATVGYQTGSQSYEYARAYCGPELWSPCELVYVDTRGELRSCLVAFPETDTAASQSQPPCQSGFGSSWCRLTLGPCTVTVTTWSAWGDRWATVDCQGGGAGPTCHTEVHTLPPNHEHWCAF